MFDQLAADEKAEPDQPIDGEPFAGMLSAEVPGPAVETGQVVVADWNLLQPADAVGAGADQADGGGEAALGVRRWASVNSPSADFALGSICKPTSAASLALRVSVDAAAS